MNRTILRSVTAGLAVFVLAALALAQNADKNTAGPTANQLQLRLIEPREGSTITGNQVRVTVAYNTTTFGQGQGTKFGEPNFPHPIFDIFVDNDRRQSLKGGEANVATLENVPPGNHKIVVMAKNISGEVIDRKEVRFITVEAPSSAATTTQERTETTMNVPPPAPEPAPAPAPPPAATEMTTETDTRDELPATASSQPRVALMGLSLFWRASFWLARRAKSFAIRSGAIRRRTDS